MVRIYGLSTPGKGTAQLQVKIYSALFFENGRKFPSFLHQGVHLGRKWEDRQPPMEAFLFVNEVETTDWWTLFSRFCFLFYLHPSLIAEVRSQQREVLLERKGE
ncbi:hypothetical protein NPIL_199071 [Nephila pilipes]|uniref:Uncharacterized protein n=1 Tax=Nephila pilipes TaxID=299642 RepID=A0A8X6NR44_NEPPI|nr:hypothetical protein NPIL_199071 [Nephila pilipes]